jgi:hypothetical protein
MLVFLLNILQLIYFARTTGVYPRAGFTSFPVLYSCHIPSLFAGIVASERLSFPASSNITTQHSIRGLSNLDVAMKTLTESLKTFFDPTFEPEIMIGPTTIDFAVEFFTRHNSSLDGLLSILQVCYSFLQRFIINTGNSWLT